MVNEKSANGQTPAETLSQLLDGVKGLKFTFSKNCCSGIVRVLGPEAVCQCWRCRGGRGLPVDEATEEQAEITSKRAQRAMRHAVKRMIAENHT